jgi:hypothetical protein
LGKTGKVEKPEKPGKLTPHRKEHCALRASARSENNDALLVTGQENLNFFVFLILLINLKIPKKLIYPISA